MCSLYRKKVKRGVLHQGIRQALRYTEMQQYVQVPFLSSHAGKKNYYKQH